MMDRTLYSALAIAGATPFMACAVLPLLGLESVSPFGRLDAVASAYGMAIICFLAGIHWSTHFSPRASAPFNLLVSSNAVFLAVFLAYLAASLEWALAVQVLAFIFLLFIDYRLKQDGFITAGYFRIRFLATLIAVVSLLAILVT